MKPYVWIVEMLICDLPDKWSPTVEAALSRDEAKQKMKEWREQNPEDKFRVARYVKDKP
jgi:hypothetical protein